jgi:hypothetical protein
MSIATAPIKPEELKAGHFLETVSAKAAPPEVVKASDAARAAWLAYREAIDQVSEAQQDIEHAVAFDRGVDRAAEAAGEDYPEPHQAERIARATLADANRRRDTRASVVSETYAHFAAVQAEHHAAWIEAQRALSDQTAAELLEALKVARTAYRDMVAAKSVSTALDMWHGVGSRHGALQLITDAQASKTLAGVEHAMGVARESAGKDWAAKKTTVPNEVGHLFAHIELAAEREHASTPSAEKVSRAAAIEAANAREDRLQRRAARRSVEAH